MFFGKRRNRIVASGIFTFIVFALASHGVAADSAAARCIGDLRYLPAFLLDNDAGAQDHLSLKGEALLDAALQTALADAARVGNTDECVVVLRNYLKHWRADHINARSLEANAAEVSSESSVAPKREPSLYFPSSATAVLVIPSFNGRFRQALGDLLEEHEAALQARRNWIIDVRRNSGGSDSTYAPLLPWLMPGEYVNVGAEFLATPANIAATESICTQIAAGDAGCKAFSDRIVGAMRAAEAGSFAALDDSAVSYIETNVRAGVPERVAVLMDRYCGSTCEQFLLTVRQSFRVKLIGRNSAGALDYSNLRPHTLPSGRIALHYATSRSRRLPAMPVDVAGVMPDIYLPAPASDGEWDNEVPRVQRWLEGGSLAPLID